jgi:hypothetical protein
MMIDKSYTIKNPKEGSERMTRRDMQGRERDESRKNVRNDGLITEETSTTDERRFLSCHRPMEGFFKKRVKKRHTMKPFDNKYESLLTSSSDVSNWERKLSKNVTGTQFEAAMEKNALVLIPAHAQFRSLAFDPRIHIS